MLLCHPLVRALVARNRDVFILWVNGANAGNIVKTLCLNASCKHHGQGNNGKTFHEELLGLDGVELTKRQLNES